MGSQESGAQRLTETDGESGHEQLPFRGPAERALFRPNVIGNRKAQISPWKEQCRHEGHEVSSCDSSTLSLSRRNGPGTTADSPIIEAHPPQQIGVKLIAAIDQNRIRHKRQDAI